MLRALVVASCLLLPAVAATFGTTLPSYVLAGLSLVMVLPVVVVRRDQWFTAVLGGAMIAVATLVAPPAMEDIKSGAPETWPLYDLTESGIDEGAQGQVRVMGYLRTEWILDEYAVGEGDRPDLNTPAVARLVPLLGSLDRQIQADNRIVVARVHGTGALKTSKQEFSGTLRPLRPELLESLFATAGPKRDQLRGLLLDTLEVPAVQRGWRSLIIAVVATLIGLGILWFATGPGHDKTAPEQT